MLTFVHTSDIHFSSGDDSSQFDLNQHIRRALLDDLATHPADGSSYDALLISGDIAYSGKKHEYESAKAWLAEVFDRTGLSMKETYVVPGNHDVDRAFVQPNFPLWASHREIQNSADPVSWRIALETQLRRDPTQLLLAPLRAFNDFAQGCGCQTTATDLVWQLDFPRPLEDGRVVRFYGLNSALISDAADAPGRLLISEFQTAKFRNAPDVINVVICHHPPDWLMDKAHVRDVLRSFAPVALFGHEHSVRVQADEKQVQLFAGAVQPPRNEPLGWLPTYHILQLGVVGSTERPELLVRVHTREFDARHYCFLAGRNEEGHSVIERKLTLARMVPPAIPNTTALETRAEKAVELPAPMPDAKDSSEKTPATDAERELLVFFFQLRTPQRYETAFKADLLRDGDDALDPQVMWAEVFRRAAEEGKLAAFWTAVAQHTPAMLEKPNPFYTHADA